MLLISVLLKDKFMAGIIKLLTNTEIEKAKSKDKNFKLTDGKGLFLLIRPTGLSYGDLIITNLLQLRLNVRILVWEGIPMCL